MPLSELNHHLRTALHHMIGYTEIFLEDVDVHKHPQISAILRQAHVAAKSAQSAIDSMSVAGMPNLGRLRDLSDGLLEAGNKLVGWSQELERLARLEHDVGLLSDVSRFLTAARGLVAAGQLVSGWRDSEPMEPQAGPGQSGRTFATTVDLPGHSLGAGGNGLLLVVDDNEANRDILSRRLKKAGYGVLVAESGLQGLAMVRARQPDLILLDVMMPDVDGVAMLRELKLDLGLRHIPVVMISSASEIQSVVRCIEMGADDYLAKPFDPILLRARVGALLERKRLRDQEQQKNAELEKALAEVQRQSQAVEKLLHNILPEKVAAELRSKGSVDPMYFEDVTVVFADFAGFTLATEKLPADRLVSLLHEYFTAFDGVMMRYKVEKLKTIGDCYMFAGGLPVPNASHPVDTILAALEMVHMVRQMRAGGGHLDSELRVGIHTGPVVAGVVGSHKFAFDIWGDAVNFSARTEQSGAPGRVNLSAATHARVKGFFACQHRGKVRIKDGRTVDMYFVVGLSRALLRDKSQSVLSSFENRYRICFHKELGSFPEYLLSSKGRAG